MNYYRRPRVNAHLLKLAGYTAGGAALGGGLGTLLGAGIGYGLGSKDKKLLSTLLGAGIGGVGGLGIGAGLGNAYTGYKKQQVLNQLLPMFERTLGGVTATPTNTSRPASSQRSDLVWHEGTPIQRQILPMTPDIPIKRTLL